MTETFTSLSSVLCVHSVDSCDRHFLHTIVFENGHILPCVDAFEDDYMYYAVCVPRLFHSRSFFVVFFSVIICEPCYHRFLQLLNNLK
jgi:hypothetical protein